MREDSPKLPRVPVRILIREVNWLGDAVMTTPALQRLRQRYPAAHIALLCPQKQAELWFHFQHVNEVLTFLPGQSPWTVGRRLRASSFDTALILPNSPRAALETWFARIPQRVGYAKRWRNLFLTQRVASRPDRKVMRKRSPRQIQDLVRTNPSPSATASRYLKPDGCASHQLNEYLHLVAQLGADPEPVTPALSVHVEEIRAATVKFGLNDPSLAGKSILALNPGAEYGAAKRWPVENFIAAATEIQKLNSCIIVILGARSDIALADRIYSAFRTPHSALKNLAGKTSLRELMALLRTAQVLLTNDTGPMHLAAALGTSVVVPFGSTSPELTCPGLPGDTHHYLLTSNAPCAPCFRRTCPIDFRCMKAISVESVVAAVQAALATSAKAA